MTVNTAFAFESTLPVMDLWWTTGQGDLQRPKFPYMGGIGFNPYFQAPDGETWSDNEYWVFLLALLESAWAYSFVKDSQYTYPPPVYKDGYVKLILGTPSTGPEVLYA